MHWIDLLIVAVIAWLTFRAFGKGLIREAVGLLSLVLGVGLAGIFYDGLAPRLPFFVGDRVRNLVSFGVIFVGTVVAGALIAALIRRAAALMMLGPVDRIGGAVFGFIKAVVLVQVALIALAVFPPGEAIASAVGSSRIASLFLDDVPLVELALPDDFENPLEQLARWREAAASAPVPGADR